MHSLYKSTKKKRFGVDVSAPKQQKVQRRSLLETNVVQYIIRFYIYIKLSIKARRKHQKDKELEILSGATWILQGEMSPDSAVNGCAFSSKCIGENWLEPKHKAIKKRKSVFPFFGLRNPI